MGRVAGTRSRPLERQNVTFRTAAYVAQPIRARLLGPTDLRVGDRILTGRDWPRRQARSILLQLLGTPGHRLPRDVVLDAHWPDQELSASLNALYKSLHALRRTLEPDLQRGRESAHIDVGNDHIALVHHDGLWVDVDRFDHLVQQAERMDDPRDSLRAALALYRGEFVADEPYVDWPVARREALRATRVRATLKLAQLDQAWGDPLGTIGYLEGLLADDPAFEEAHRAIVRALLASGQRALALQQIERCRLALDREFGTVPDDETRELEALTRSLIQPSIDLATSGGRTTMLGVPGLPTTTVGRKREIDHVRIMLADAGTRLVTILGPGGVGKTRLATEVARAAGSDFPDGVAFVDLTGIRDAALVPPSIMSVLNVPVSAGRPMVDAIADWLAVRPRFLLVLDNLEHLAGVEDLTAQVLAAVPSLTVLATSREPLRIRAEWIYRLAPLAVPEMEAAELPVRHVASVRLFLQLSRAWGRNDAGTNDDHLADIAMLCRRLEGLPLAIELAAARTWEMEPGAILATIDDRFIALRDGPRDLPARHQALEAMIGWSYDLLSADERHLFRRLAVFAGGAESDALEMLFGADALSLAERLADKSLVRWTQRNGGRRLDMLATTRAYAMRMLEDHGELVATQLAHARYYAELAVRSGFDEAKRGSAQIGWIRRLEREQENIHQALANCLDLGESDTALVITNVMGSYWNTHLPVELARSWIEQALAMEPEGYHLSAGWSATWGATFAWRTLDQDAAIAFEERARQIWTRLESPRGLAWVEYHRAERLGFAGRYDEMRAIHESNLRIFQQEGDVEGIVHALVGLSVSLGMTGQPERACLALEQALAVARDAGDLLLHSLILGRLATALLNAGEVERAEAIAVETERLAHLIGDPQSLAFAATVRAWLAFDRNDVPGALVQAQAALLSTRDLGASQVAWVPLMIWTLATATLGQFDDARVGARELIHSVLAYGGDPCRATVLPELATCILALGYPAEALMAYAAGLDRERAWVAPLPPSCEQRYREGIRTARAQLDRNEAIRAWDRGRTMALTDALDVVRRVVAGA